MEGTQAPIQIGIWKQVPYIKNSNKEATGPVVGDALTSNDTIVDDSQVMEEETIINDTETDDETIISDTETDDVTIINDTETDDVTIINDTEDDRSEVGDERASENFQAADVDLRLHVLRQVMALQAGEAIRLGPSGLEFLPLFDNQSVSHVIGRYKNVVSAESDEGIGYVVYREYNGVRLLTIFSQKQMLTRKLFAAALYGVTETRTLREVLEMMCTFSESRLDPRCRVSRKASLDVITGYLTLWRADFEDPNPWVFVYSTNRSGKWEILQ